MVAVLLPGDSIFALAAIFIPQAAMDEQRRDKDEVKVGEKMLGAASQAIGEGEKQVACVVHMAGDAPPAGDQQFRVAFLAVGSEIFARDKLGSCSPDQDLAVLFAKAVFLVIG